MQTMDMCLASEDAVEAVKEGRQRDDVQQPGGHVVHVPVVGEHPGPRAAAALDGRAGD